jgi:hypothetical protein
MEALIRKKLRNHPQRGFAVVLLIMILVIATAIGVWGLRSSQNTLRRIGVRRTVTELKYEAEKGLQKAVLRLQSIANKDTTDDDTDNIALTNADAGGVTGGDYNEKDLIWLMNTLPDESTEGASANPACGTFVAEENFDTIANNVVCNFLGVAEENTHVSLVRKNDVNEGGLTFGIFLLNSIAYESSGRRQIIQGVVVVPYTDNGDGTFTLNETPYLSNSKTVSD